MLHFFCVDHTGTSWGEQVFYALAVVVVVVVVMEEVVVVCVCNFAFLSKYSKSIRLHLSL